MGWLRWLGWLGGVGWLWWIEWLGLFKSLALLMAKFPKLLLTDLFEYWPNEDLSNWITDRLLIFILTERNQGRMVWRLTQLFQKTDRCLKWLVWQLVGLANYSQWNGSSLYLFFNGIVGRLHISADSYIHFLWTWWVHFKSPLSLTSNFPAWKYVLGMT